MAFICSMAATTRGQRLYGKGFLLAVMATAVQVLLIRRSYGWAAFSRANVFPKMRQHVCRVPVCPLTSPAALPPVARKAVGWWLMGCCGLVAGSVVLGGITRLTESGLSMTKWHLVKGMRPPHTQQEWEAEFQRYQEFPEYQFIHKDLTLEGFKRIFYMEYAHRMWGRLVGLAVLVPAAGFWATGWLNTALKRRAVLYSVLVVAQGLLGWWMVKSGLEPKAAATDVPRVSQYRLASHLGMALALYSSMFYTALGLLAPPPNIAAASKPLIRLRHVTHGATAIIFFTALSGAFVAGLDAGLVYNSFPKMAGRWVPQDWMQFSPKVKNFFENPSTVQFDHRLLGVTTLSFVLGCWALARGVGVPARARVAANCMAAMAMTQVALGISTLLYYVPTPLAAAHQAGSLTLLTLALWLMSELRKIVPRF